jgi:hypothetical protein
MSGTTWVSFKFTGKVYVGSIKLRTIHKAGHWWLMPVILPTQEAEIRRIKVPSQSRKIVPILKKTITKKGWWSGSRCRP